jgi:hypothetical protein
MAKPWIFEVLGAGRWAIKSPEIGDRPVMRSDEEAALTAPHVTVAAGLLAAQSPRMRILLKQSLRLVRKVLDDQLMPNEGEDIQTELCKLENEMEILEANIEGKETPEDGASIQRRSGVEQGRRAAAAGIG